jgi:hypothetical protein
VPKIPAGVRGFFGQLSSEDVTTESEGASLPIPPDEHLREIGRVAVIFTKLEAILRLLIRYLFQGDDVSKDVAVLGDSFRDLLMKLDRLVEARVLDRDLKELIKRWRQEAKRANDLRIETVHSSWIMAARGEEALVLLHRKSGTIHGGLLTSEQVAARADYIILVGRQGIEILKRLHESLPELNDDQESAGETGSQ